MIFKSLFRRQIRARIVRQPVMEAFEPRQLLSTDVLTYHYDNTRSGANTTETILNRSNVNSTTFGKKLSIAVQGQIYAEPLYVSNLRFPDKSVHNVVYVATEHDQVYAFDANTGATLWHFSVIKKGQSAIPFDDVGAADISPEIGITSTPVIDKVHGAIYFVAKLKILAGPQYFTRLYCLNLTTGAYKFHQPINIQGSVAGTGLGSNNGVIDFDPLIEGQRAALTLVNGKVYIPFASHGGLGNYHGWVFGYNATTLQRTDIWNDSPSGQQAGIWQTGNGIAVDAQGNLYFATGNGTFTANGGGADYGDSVVRVPTANNAPFAPADYFSPFDEDNLATLDLDFGTTGVLLLPNQAGAHPHELIVGGKEGKLYVVDRDNMGQFNNGFDDIVQTVQANGRNGGFDAPVYYGGKIYYTSVNGALEAFSVQNGVLSHIPKTSSETYGFPGATASVSASGNHNGIVWVIAHPNGNAVLEAFNSADLTQVLYTSEDAGSRDEASTYVKFSTPTVADGRVFVGTGDHLEIYGLL